MLRDKFKKDLNLGNLFKGKEMLRHEVAEVVNGKNLLINSIPKLMVCHCANLI